MRLIPRVLFFITISMAILVVWCSPVFGQVPKAPPRSEGQGPFDELIIRGATLIDGYTITQPGMKR